MRFNEETYHDLKYVNSNYLIKNNANAYIIGEMLTKLRDGGKMIFLMPNGFLTSSLGQEVKLKKMILKDFNLESITSLPGNIVSNTNISLNLIVISKNKPTGKVKMVDGSECFIRKSSSQNIIDVEVVSHLIKSVDSNEKVLTISEEDIKLNDFSLLPQRYLVESSSKIDLSNAKPLGDVIMYIKPIRYQKSEFGKKIGIKDLQDSPDQYTIDYSQLTQEELPKGVARLNRNSLLVASKGLKLKPTYIGNVGMDIYYTPQNIFEFNVESDNVNIDYLIAELHKDYVQKQLAKFTVGAGIPSITRKQLLSIRIFLPSIDEQLQIVEKEKTERFQQKLKELGFEREIAQIRKEQKEDLSSKKHNIMQHINNVKSSADVLIGFMEKNGGQLRANDIINQRRGVTVEQRFRRLVDSLEDSIYYINNLTNEVRFGEKKIVNLKKLIDSCIEKGIQGKNYEVLPLEVDETSFIESSNTIEPIAFISPDDFEEVYNNLLENAVRHGFLKDNNLYSFRIEMSYDSDVKQIVILFSNNGEPLPKGMADRYGIKGEKAGKTGNKGYGAWKIKQIANYWEAGFEVLDSSESTNKVAFELRLNVEQE
ncbi:N-6 DNA methylase [Saccharicrinis fermentans]|uniref:N-6 DNA methylase n=1 Tax=Saccharicrinis fermentans TaxID=982 RepID=UPI0021D3D553|nr:N-6 DNA methylase [Saccharicrinis fermentans]